MLEIIGMIVFGLKLAAKAREKGRSGVWGLLGVGMWIGGELFGLVLGALLGLELLPMMAIGWACAIAGAVVSYFIVSSLEPTGYALEAANDPFARNEAA